MYRILLAGTALGELTMAPALQSAPIHVKFSHVVAETTPRGQCTELLEQLVKWRLSGRVEVQVFSNASLMEDDPSMEALAFGDVQTIAPSHGALDHMLTAGVANMSVSQVTRAATPWFSVLVLVTYVPAISPPCRI
ncbi:MAG: hypothetical protein WAS21_01215 [Geminicoccaceae bacterium]